VALLVLVAAAASCRGGCGRESPAAARDRVLGALPAGTRFVASVDVAKIRSTALWSRISALAENQASDRGRIQSLTARTGFDPLRQIHRIVAAFPDDARTSGQFALVFEGAGFDESRLVAFAREEAVAGGGRLEVRSRGQRTLYAGGGADRAAGFFDGHSRFLLGAGGWAEAMADLADGVAGTTSAADDAELAHLVGRIDPGRAIWLAAIVPLDLRKRLMADPKLESAGSLTRLAASADLGPGLVAEMVADLSNAADARTLVSRIQTTLRESKRDAKVLMMGLGPYLDAVEARADGPTLRVKVTLAEGQVKDLLERLTGLSRLARARRTP
jgi:hypothetical protein